MKPSETGRRGGEIISIEVTPSHIEEMYDRFDSGMADHSSVNAIVLAMRSHLGRGLKLRTKKTGSQSWAVKMCGQLLPLPEVVNQWFLALYDGYHVSAFEFEMELPRTLQFPSHRIVVSREGVIVGSTEVA